MVISLVFIFGCSKKISNDEIISEAEKCKAAGMSYLVQRGGIGYSHVRSVTCI